MNARVILHPRRARPFYGRHPWVYAGAIARVEGEPADGDPVELYSHTGNFIAHGWYNSRSKIRVRLYSWSPGVPIGTEFFRQQLRAASDLRARLGLFDARTACRLVFSEGDGLSGLTVDYYAGWLVVQFTAFGMAKRREAIYDLLVELWGLEGIYLRTERGIGQLEGLELQDSLVRGYDPPQPVVITENGTRFQIDLEEGQKTGFYLDQRENRLAVAPLARGRRLLDAFCYTGGFGLHAARAGAAAVLSIDVSEPALTLAQTNAQLNGLTNITFERGDVFDRLTALAAAGERFGMVVMDPPKFARAQTAVKDALSGYRRLMTLALRLLEVDGILVFCCCSGLINVTMLDELLAQVAVEERRVVQILAHRGQAPDHPVSAVCLETNYLKCLVCRVGASIPRG